MGCVYTALVLFIWSDILKVLFVSLGCDKNRVETEYMLGLLSEHGYEFTDDAEAYVWINKEDGFVIGNVIDVLEGLEIAPLI